MPNAGTVNVVLTAVTGPFEAGMKKAAGVVSGFGSTLTSVKALATGFLAFKGVQFVKGMMEAVDQTAKLADRLGASTEAVIGLQHAGDLAGVSIDAIATNMEKMSRNLADAGAKASPVTKALEAMGIAVGDIKGKAPEVQLGMIADGLQKIGGPGERAAAAVDIFGKAGAGMTNMLADGSAGLRAAREEADALGLSFSRLEAAKVEQANDALSKVGALFRGGFTQAAIALAPTIEGIANAFIDATKAAGGMGQIALSVVDALKRGAGIAADAWNVLRAGWDAGRVAVNMIGAAWANVADATTRAIQWWSGVWWNWVQLVQDSTASLSATFGWLWAKAKEPIASFVQFSGSKLSELLHQAAEATSRLDTDLSSSLRAAAGSIATSTGDAALKARAAAEQAGAAMTTAAANVKSSWANLFNVQTTGSPMMQQMAAGFMKAGTQAAVDYTASFKTVLDQDGSAAVKDWFAKIEAMSTASATAAAERNAQRLKLDLEASQAAQAQAQADSEWTTELFGKQSDKQLAWEKRNMAAKLDYASGMLGNLATLQNTSSRKMFEIGKIAAYGQAIVSTAAGIARQFADLPIYLAIPAAAAVAVAGAVQIASIASTSFGGGGSVSSAGGSVPLVGGEPVGVSRGAEESFASRNSQQVQRVEFVGLEDDHVFSGRQMRKIIDRFVEVAKDSGGTLRFDMATA